MEVPDGLVALQYLEGKPGVWRDCVVVEIQVDWPEVLLAHLLGRATWGRLSMGGKFKSILNSIQNSIFVPLIRVPVLRKGA